MPDQLIRQMIEHPVACTFSIPGEDVWARGRGDPRKVLARQVAMYLAHVTCGLTLTETGHLFLRDRTTVAHACKRVELLRDDRRFDHALELLEGAVRSLSPPYAAFALAC